MVTYPQTHKQPVAITILCAAASPARSVKILNVNVACNTLAVQRIVLSIKFYRNRSQWTMPIEKVSIGHVSVTT